MTPCKVNYFTVLETELYTRDIIATQFSKYHIDILKLFSLTRFSLKSGILCARGKVHF